MLQYLKDFEKNVLMDVACRMAAAAQTAPKASGQDKIVTAVVTDEEKIGVMEEIIFSETTTIGIRRQRMERTVLARRKDKLMTRYGELEVKLCGDPGQLKVYPEYESAAKLAAENGVPLREVYTEAERVVGPGEQIWTD